MLQELKETNESDKVEAKDKLEMAQHSITEITHHIEYKKKVNEDLKAKIESINIPEENYISEDDPISESKFPILAEIYMKVERMGSSGSLKELQEVFPFLLEDFGDNLTALKWN